MRKILEWLCIRWVENEGQTTREFMKKIRLLEKEKKKSEHELTVAKSRLKRASDSFEKSVSAMTLAVNRAEGLNRRYEEALAASTTALKTMEEIIIPGLVAANQTFQNAWDAESSQFVRKGMLPKEPSEG